MSTGTRIARFLVILLLLVGFGYGVYTKYVKPAPEQVLREKTSQIDRAPSLSVVVDSWIGSMPVQLIKARSYDQELGFNLKVSYAESDLDRMMMLSKNEVDATSIAVNYSGLQGSSISKMARIMGVVDCYDAMITDRPYRAGMGRSKALVILREDVTRGRLDGLVVDALESIVSGRRNG